MEEEFDINLLLKDQGSCVKSWLVTDDLNETRTPMLPTPVPLR